MSKKTVAVEGNVIATAGKKPYTGADSGKWVTGTVAYKSYDQLKVGKTKVIYEAKCTFNFVGTNSAGTAVKGKEMVVLKASSTKMQKGLYKVLLDGDTAKGKFGNKLKINASHKLTIS